MTVRGHMTPTIPATHSHRAECSCGWYADRSHPAGAHAAGLSHVGAAPFADIIAAHERGSTVLHDRLTGGDTSDVDSRPLAGRGAGVPEGWTLDDDGIARRPARSQAGARETRAHDAEVGS